MRAPKYPLMPATLGNIRPEREASVSELTRAQKEILANTSQVVPVTGQYYDLIRAGQQVQTSAPKALTNAMVRGVFNKAGGVRSFAAAGYNYPSGKMVIGAALAGLGAPIVRRAAIPGAGVTGGASPGTGSSGGILSVSAAQQQVAAAQRLLADARTILPAVFSEKPLDWHDLPGPGLVPDSMSTEEITVRVMDFLANKDPSMLADMVKSPATPNADRFVAWAILRLLYRPSNGVSWSNLGNSILGNRVDFRQGLGWDKVDGDPEGQLASDAVTLANIGAKRNWAGRWGVTMRRAYIWATKYARPARDSAIAAANAAIQSAQVALGLAQQKAALEQRLATATTSGGMTQAQYDDLLKQKKAADDAAQQALADADKKVQEAAEKAAAEAAQLLADSKKKTLMVAAGVGAAALVAGFLFFRRKSA